MKEARAGLFHSGRGGGIKRKGERESESVGTGERKGDEEEEASLKAVDRDPGRLTSPCLHVFVG